MAVRCSSIKHHKLKRRVELKERKILEILKNHFGQFYKFNNDNQIHTSYGLKKKTNVHCTISFLLPCSWILYSCRDISSEVFRNSYILPSLKYFTSANYDVLASYTIFIQFTS